jgi:glycosyltransferase involved in cell wall biosynthesis
VTTFQPTIDVVIAALNEELSIGRCLNSLTHQDYPSHLVNVFVVVDGRTTDDTAKLAAAHGAHVILAEGTGVAFVRDLGFAKGEGELVGFLDAHCFPEPGWISAMVSPFVDPMVGGCQGNVESVCDSWAVQRFLKQSLFSSNERMIEHTVGGQFSPYPWIVGGSSVFRRRAVDEAGVSISCPCDDTDRSWKVFLEGYQLVHARDANLIHHDHASLRSYLRKQFYFGVGAAQLAYAHGHEGKRNKKDRRYKRTPEVTLIDLIYECGYSVERMAQRQGLITLPKRNREAVQKRFRPRFSWSDQASVQISPHVVFWRVGDESVVCVHLINNTRIVFDGVANLIFRQLIAERPQDATCASIVEYFDADQSSVESDVNEFIEQLRQEGILNVLTKDVVDRLDNHPPTGLRCNSH